MKKAKPIITALLVLLAFAVGQVYAGSASDAQYGMQSSAMDQSQGAMKVSEVMGKTVKDQQGQELGTVDDLIIGDQGQVDYVVLSPTGDLAQEDQLIPLPWQIIQAQSGQEDLTATVEMDRLRDAPSITEDQMQELSSQEMQDRVRGYYGVEQQQPGMMQQPGMQHDGMMQDGMHQQQTQPGMEGQETGQ